MLLSRIIVVAVFCQMLVPPVSGQEVVYVGNKRVDYFTELLELALSYTPNKNYKLGFYNQDIPKLRAFSMIAQSKGIDLIAAGSNMAREEVLMPIRIPLLKGLFGWRIPLIHKDDQALFSSPNSIEKFRDFSAGQMLNWSDTAVLESNGVTVVKGANYQGLFQMLATKRFDYFPRSILEIDEELLCNSHLPLVKDKNILIHYPTAYYYYVAKDNLELADDLKHGLEQAISDGRFNQLFSRYYGEEVEQVRSEKRNIIQLANPFLPEKTPFEREELWLNFTSTH